MDPVASRIGRPGQGEGLGDLPKQDLASLGVGRRRKDDEPDGTETVRRPTVDRQGEERRWPKGVSCRF